MHDKVDCVVIGAGVVGLAVARALALAGREVLVLEAEGAIGTQTSARNSEVIHAGLYYPPGSLKGRLCVRGKELLYAYLAERGLPHRRCGKLIVACAPPQVGALRNIQARAGLNGVHDLRWLTGDEAMHLEPQLRCEAALLSPSTGIVDSHAFMLALQGDLERAGGLVALRSPVACARGSGDGIVVETVDGTKLEARTVVNAAGLRAPALALRFPMLDSRHVPQARFAKGSYFSLMGRAPFSHLVYPVPEAAGLGVHLTLDLAGQARFGPDVQWVDDAEDLDVDPERQAVFEHQVRSYWPALPHGSLAPAYAGMRPKIHAPDEPAADFCIQGPAAHGVRGLVNLFGIESPGLTSALAIGEYVAALPHL